MDSTYDGNALAGPLSEVFAADVTIAVARCRGCGLSSVVAELAVYGPDPGWVARCPGCEDILLRLVRDTGLGLGRPGRHELPSPPGPRRRAVTLAGTCGAAVRSH